VAPTVPAAVPTTVIPTTVPTTAPVTTAPAGERVTSTTAELVRLHASPAGQLGRAPATDDGRRVMAAAGALLVAMAAFGVARHHRRATNAPTD
jgi:hypothetical protein